MNDTTGRGGASSNVRSLTEAIRKARVAESERADVVVEIREAERARLDMLADELRAVFAELPDGDEQFILQISGGTQPRLWIDMTSFVLMGRDRRTYRFLKDTRLGRTVILETADLEDMADCVTHYVAERIIERERALESDWLSARIRRADPGILDERRLQPSRNRLIFAAAPAASVAAAPARDRMATGLVLAAFLIAFLGGLVLGALALGAYAWMHAA